MPLSPEQLDWIKRTRSMAGGGGDPAPATNGDETRAPAKAAPPPAANGAPAGAESAPGEAAPQATGGGASVKAGTVVEQSIPMPKVPWAVGYFSGEIGYTMKVKGSLDFSSGKGDSSNDVTPVGVQDGAMVERLGKTWYSTDGVKIFGLNTGASESKIVGQAKVKDGLEVTLQVGLKWANGEELTLKFTVVKLEKEWKVTAGSAQLEYTFKAITGEFKWGSAKFKGSIQVASFGSVQPNYTAIAAQIGSNASAVASAGRAVAAFVTFDMLIAGALVAGAVMTVVGTVQAVAKAAEIRGLHGLAEKTAKAMVTGFMAGVTGKPNGAGTLGAAGYDMGKKGLESLRQKLKDKVPDATEDEIREAVEGACQGKESAVYERMYPLAQQAVWEAWAAENKGSKDLKWGWVNLYGKMPSDSDAEYTKFL
jgi:hypothetical protein